MTSQIQLNDLYARRANVLPSSPDELEPEQGVIDFTFGHPDATLFPVAALSSAIQTILTSSAREALQYSDFRGSQCMLDALTSYLGGKHKRAISPQNLIITNGSMQVLDLLAEVFLDPGDMVLVEAPTYFRAVTIFRTHDAKIEAIPIDQEGLRIDLLEDYLRTNSQRSRRLKFLYTIPTFQNPSGTTLSLERRRHLINLRDRYGFIILEDTAYNDLWYDQEPPQSLLSLDSSIEGIVQMGTFSKLIAPGLSIGWALGAAPVIRRFVEFKADGCTAPFASHIVASILGSPTFEQHVKALRLANKIKRDAAVTAIEEHLRNYVTFYRPSGGYFVWLELRTAASIEELWSIAASERVIFLPGRFCFASGQTELPLIRLAFSALNKEEIEEGIRRLGRAVQRLLDR